MSNIDEIMINKGDEITCIETLKSNGRIYFYEGESYLSPENNCLKSELGDCFIQQQYLKHFAFKTN